MNRIKILIAAGIMTLASNASAMDTPTTPVIPSVSDTKTTVVQQNIDDKNLNETIAKFEALVKEVMSTESPSCLKAGGVATLRILVKVTLSFLICHFFYAYICNKDGDDWLDLNSKQNYGKYAPATCAIVATILMTGIALLSDRFIKTGDHLLCKLKNLERYISKLSVQEKTVIAAQFKEKYRRNLDDLLVQQNHCSAMSFGKYIPLVIELLIIAFIYTFGTENSWSPFVKFNDESNELIVDNAAKLSMCIIALINIYQIVTKARTNPEYEKDRVFAEIQKILAEV